MIQTIKKFPSLNFEKLSALLPNFIDKQPQYDSLWQNELALGGWKSLALPPKKILEQGAFGIESITVIPPVIRVGRLALELESEISTQAKKYMGNIDYPAFVSLRDGPGVTFLDDGGSGRVQTMAQMSLVQMLTILDPAVVKVTSLDLTHWGTACELLRAAVPGLDLITDANGKRDFFQKIREEVIKKTQYLGVRHKSLYDYNFANPDAPQAYHFIYVSNYSKDIDENERELILSLMALGPSGIPTCAKSGIYFFIMFGDERDQTDFLRKCTNIPSIKIETDESNAIKIEIEDSNGISTTKLAISSQFEVIPDQLETETMSVLVDRCHAHLMTKRVPPVLFQLKIDNCWTASSARGLRLPIGKNGSQLVYFALGSPEIVHNALVGGAVGTGKTILLHAIICQALYEYSPEELKLSLLDYKEGTEFSVYSTAPHIHALSLGSNPKFGLDLLKSFQQEISNRASLFKEHPGVQNLESYRSVTGEVLCRHLLVIDEFQVLLNSPKIGSEAQLLLEDIIRRGRSFGFNVILSSQSLSDGSLPAALRANLGSRICLRLSERECFDFLGPDNTLPSTFQYPGQAVYNNREGSVEGNLEFRVAYFDQKQISELVDSLSKLASERQIRSEVRYIYNGETELEITFDSFTRPNSLFIGIEEGIPPIKHYVDMPSAKSARGQVFAFAGAGNARNLAINLFQSQIEILDSVGIITLESNDVRDFCLSIIDDPSSIDYSGFILMHIDKKMAELYQIKEACDYLLENGLFITLVVDSLETLESIGFSSRERDLTVCCDRRSVDSLSYGSLTLNPAIRDTVLFARPFEDPIFVRIPTVNQH